MSHFRSYLPYLILWTLVNLVQAAFTGLIHDEAYYWVYAQNLAWGYFDHPPAIAICIWMGSALFDGEIGVRLIPVFLSTATMGILFHWVRPDKNRLFFLFMCSITVIHMGFLAAPDVPLITVACLFMVLFERYLVRDNWRNALLLGVAAALLMYAKYHGALLILLAVLSQVHLLRRWTFWALTSIALLLYVPHFAWLVNHELVTIRYHLFERVSTGFAWQYPVEYLLGQLAMYAPITAVIIVASYSRWRRGGIDRTARWVVLGVFGIFFINTFRGRVEANWTTIALPALVYLSYKAMETSDRYVRLIRMAALITIPLIVILRLLCIVDITRAAKLEEVHGWATWAGEIREQAEGRIPVFRNSYQYASKYMFYAGKRSFSCNDAANKGNQYDLLPDYERAVQGRRVLFLSGSPTDSLWDAALAPLQTNTGRLHQRRFEAFQSYNILNISIIDALQECRAGENVEFRLEIRNPGDEAIAIDTANTKIAACFQQRGMDEPIWLSIACPLATIAAQSGQELRIHLPVDLAPGEYTYRIGMRWKETGGKNSFQQKLKVIPAQ